MQAMGSGPFNFLEFAVNHILKVAAIAIVAIAVAKRVPVLNTLV
jgi:hypothetical protein